MRRDELEIKNIEYINSYLNEVEFCTISMTEHNRIYSVPVNFVAADNALYFHSAKVGRKAELIKNETPLSISVIKAYSLIPNNFFNSKNACSSTQFFVSIFVEGRAKLLEDVNEKIFGLKLLMKKLQKENQYLELSANSYEQAIENILVIKVDIEFLSCKAKLGQTLADEKRTALIEALKNRNTALDIETINAMEKIKFFNNRTFL